jgi:hypothetical protein
MIRITVPKLNNGRVSLAINVASTHTIVHTVVLTERLDRLDPGQWQ